MSVRLTPWRDRRGRVSPLRITTLLLLVAPLINALLEWRMIAHGARPLNELIHRAGFWALMFLLASLAITPLRRIARAGRLVDVRRMIGVAAFCCAATHIALFTADQMFDLTKVASEIVHRIYLIIGFTALIGLAILASTSTDGMVRRLGGTPWQTLHRAAYVIAGLALIHFFQQTKADVWVPTLFAGLFAWLMGYRLLLRLADGAPAAWSLLGLAVAAAILTFAGEAIGIGIVFNVSPMRVLQTAFDFDPAVIRPGWFVLAVGVAAVAVQLVRASLLSSEAEPGGPRSAPARAR